MKESNFHSMIQADQITQAKENTMNDVTTFNFRSHNIRTILKDGEPWFVAKDVCGVLGLSNTIEALRPLDDDERMTLRITEGHSGQRGGAQFMSVISESGLYALIFKSRKPEAKEFRKWVTSEVLPSIRKTGKYEAKPVTQTSTQLPLKEEVATRSLEALHRVATIFGYEGNQALLCADKGVRKLHGISLMALLEIELKSPNNEALMIATEIGKKLNPSISAKSVNLLLADMKLQERVEYRTGKFEWRLTDRGKEYGSYLDTGKVHSDGTPIQQIKWKESIIPLVQKHSDSL